MSGDCTIRSPRETASLAGMHHAIASNLTTSPTQGA